MFQTSTLLKRTLVTPKYGSLLVPVGLSCGSDDLVRSAVRFANEVGAHLLGVGCHAGVAMSGATPVEQEAVRLVVEACGQRFMELSGPVRAGRTWCGTEGPPEAALAEFGWAADLMMVEVGAFDGGATSVLRRLREPTFSPVLACPRGWGSVGFDRVLVVCDGSQACRRALRCAMPVIARGVEVVLLAADRSAEALRRGLITRGWSEPRVEMVRPSSSAQIEERVRELRPDVVVLGGWSERLGGWPGRSLADRLLQRGEAPLLLGA